jgi:hypothetical protein
VLVLQLGQRDLVRMEPVPDRPIDDFIRGIAENVNNGIGRVEDTGVLREV